MPEFWIGQNKRHTDFHPILSPLADISDDALRRTSGGFIHELQPLSVFHGCKKQNGGSVSIHMF